MMVSTIVTVAETAMNTIASTVSQVSNTSPSVDKSLNYYLPVPTMHPKQADGPVTVKNLNVILCTV